MKYAVILDSVFINEYARAPLGGTPAVQELARRTKEIAKRLNASVALLTSADTAHYVEDLPFETRYDAGGLTPATYFSAFKKAAGDADALVYYAADMPFVDVEETLALAKMHAERFAMYTYGENYPEGVLPVVLSKGFLNQLQTIAEEKAKPPEYNYPHTLTFLDPNLFEIEILLAPSDMRSYRLDFRAQTKRTLLLLNRLFERNATRFGDYANLLIADPSLRRTLPAYAEIEVSTKRSVTPVFAPPILREGTMSLKTFSAIYDALIAFADDLHLSFSLSGDPLTNDALFDMILYALAAPKTRVYLETTGRLFDKEWSDRITALGDPRLNVIFHLDAIDESVYDALYKDGDLKTTRENIERHVTRDAKRSYVQITKMKETINHLEAFYRHFKPYGANIILQKFNVYRNAVADQRAGDLAPFMRVPCWHLTRDISVYVDGTVPLCKEDINAEIALGVLPNDDIGALWEKGGEYYRAQAEQALDFCAHCDEWYLFNF